jgi:hypothetical protein
MWRFILAATLLLLAWEVYILWDPFGRQTVHMHDESEPCNYACGPRNRRPLS